MNALLVALTLAASSGPTFIEDDFARALKEAKTQKKLLFVDAWAPWCHTCVAMREQVFTRESFKAFEKDVVFAAVDTEKAKSAAFLETYPIQVWPTLLFIDAQTGAVVQRWLGSADEAQMKALLEAARGPAQEADAALARGDVEGASTKYKAVSGKLEARTVLSMLSALTLARQHETCARTAVDQLPTLTAPADRIAGVSWGLSCALELPEGKVRAETLPVLVKEGSASLSATGVLPDDVSSVYELLVGEREAAKDDAGKKALATQWLAYLDGEAAKAKSPGERAVFDPHRVNAALESGQPEKMISALQQSEKDFPADYNPPARLANLHRAMGEFDAGLADINRALKKCKEGPRKLRLFDTKASLYEKKGDAAGKKLTLKEELQYAKKLPKSQISVKRIAAIEEAAAK